MSECIILNQTSSNYSPADILNANCSFKVLNDLFNNPIVYDTTSLSESLIIIIL